MPVYDRLWFIATFFGLKYAATLSDAAYDFAVAIAENELLSVKCWCPKIYPVALSIKISLLLDAAGVGLTAVAAPPVVASAGSHNAYVVEDEVYDIKRKYRLVEQEKQVTKATPAAQLGRIIITCVPPIGIGATLARGLGSRFGGCCSIPADKTMDLHGFLFHDGY